MDQDGHQPSTSLEALYAAVPAAEEEDLFEQAAADERSALTALVLAELAELAGDAPGEEPAARVRRQEDPEDWSLPALLAPEPGAQWRSALALARELGEPQVVTGADGRSELRMRLPSSAALGGAWRSVMSGDEPDWATVWDDAAEQLGLPTRPEHTLLARLVAVLLEAELPAPIVADALGRCLDDAGGRAT
ncbi:MAG: hypothetical protein ACTHOD_05265 [Motilibacteraceae bacterium]